jgi:cell division protein DivIC
VKQQEYAGIASARKRKVLVRRLSLFFAFALFLSYFMVSNILSQASMLDQKVVQKKQLEGQLAGLKNQQQILKDNIVKLNDDDYIAKLARKEYFLSNKGEVIFNLPDKGEVKSTRK